MRGLVLPDTLLVWRTGAALPAGFLGEGGARVSTALLARCCCCCWPCSDISYISYMEMSISDLQPAADTQVTLMPRCQEHTMQLAKSAHLVILQGAVPVMRPEPLFSRLMQHRQG